MDTTEYIDKTILVGISVYNEHQELVTQFQKAGIIKTANCHNIIITPIGTENDFGLPPDFSQINSAEEGVYNLKDGNIAAIENPDFVACYAINVCSEEEYNLSALIGNGFVPAEQLG